LQTTKGASATDAGDSARRLADDERKPDRETPLQLHGQTYDAVATPTKTVNQASNLVRMAGNTSTTVLR
jgi:hypothetical protein